MGSRRWLMRILIALGILLVLIRPWRFDLSADAVTDSQPPPRPTSMPIQAPALPTDRAIAETGPVVVTTPTQSSDPIGPSRHCMPFEQLSQTAQWRKTEEWLDALGSGLLNDIVSNSRTSKLAHYLDYSPAQLADAITRGDASAKLVKAELNYQQARGLAFGPDGASGEQALQLIREARQLWWDAVLDGGYTTALTNMGQSYFIDESVLEQRGELSFNKRLELEKLSFRYGEAPEELIEGLGENFFQFGDMLAPVDVLQAALTETVAQVEAERARRGLPSLRTKIPPEREWVMAQSVCRD